MKKTLLLFCVASTMIYASAGALLMKTNCASCHILITPTPDMIPKMKAPPMDSVMYHAKLTIPNKDNLKAFIVDYALNPKASKSVCESNKVEEFGVMPTLKGKVSPKDLSIIADYMIENYPKPKFVHMITEMQRNGKMNALKTSPFLINKSSLPHMTKVLKENWDKATLGLSDAQKSKLLTVRKETMHAVKSVKKQLNVLETGIIESMVDGENPKSLDGKIEEMAKLKVEATKVHLKCIHETIEILTDEQLEHLFPFWDM